MKIADLRLTLDHPEVIIRPEVADIGFLDDVDVHEVIKLGEKAAEAAIPELRQAVGWRSWLSRRLQSRSA